MNTARDESDLTTGRPFTTEQLSALHSVFREGHDTSLACAHRDLSCCPECFAATPGLVNVFGNVYRYVPDQWPDAEREDLTLSPDTVREPSSGVVERSTARLGRHRRRSMIRWVVEDGGDAQQALDDGDWARLAEIASALDLESIRKAAPASTWGCNHPAWQRHTATEFGSGRTMEMCDAHNLSGGASGMLQRCGSWRYLPER